MIASFNSCQTNVLEWEMKPMLNMERSLGRQIRVIFTHRLGWRGIRKKISMFSLLLGDVKQEIISCLLLCAMA